MSRQRNYLPYLIAEYARQNPNRPPKTDFNREVKALLAFLMRQIDPTGKKPIILPPMPAEGYEPQGSARSGLAVEVEA